jgi:LysR family glycine cleavage system transcriptional activator
MRLVNTWGHFGVQSSLFEPCAESPEKPMRRKIPSSNTLLCFDAAARHRSLTRAAVELSLTQSAVSRQILALEEYLGTALFKRTRHGMELTPVGADYAARVAQRLGAMEQDTLDIMGASAPGGDVHLASVPTFAAQWLIPRLGDFARTHPSITVHIDTRTRPFLFADTALDAAIYAGTPEQLQRWAGTQSLHLLDEEVVVVCHPSLLGKRKTLKAETLATMPLLQQSTRPDAWSQWFAQAQIEAPRALAGPRYEQFSMTVAAAAQGLGLALVPRLLIETELARGELVIAHPLTLASQRGYYLVRPQGSDAAGGAMGVFAQWLAQAAVKSLDPSASGT